MSAFKDHFSGHATSYAQYRPHYPDALFSWIASIAANRHLAWDCATGNGQAAVGLAKYFDKVIATDASDKQIAEAVDRPNIHYEIADAAHAPLQDHSVDVVTVAAAAHWFDLDAFYAEVKRVLKPGGLLALWSYSICLVTPEIEAVISKLFRDITGPYWPPERRHVDESYKNLQFPFPEIVAPKFEIKADLTLEQLKGYLKTWSGLQRFMTATGKDPLDMVSTELNAAWGDPSRLRVITWPIFMRVGHSPL